MTPAPPHLPVVRSRSPGLLAPGGHILLTVGIQEREHLSLRHAGSQQPGCDEPLPLLLSNHTHDLQLLNILLQPLLQVLWKGYRPPYQPRTNPLWELRPGTPKNCPQKVRAEMARQAGRKPCLWPGPFENSPVSVAVPRPLPAVLVIKPRALWVPGTGPTTKLHCPPQA